MFETFQQFLEKKLPDSYGHEFRTHGHKTSKIHEPHKGDAVDEEPHMHLNGEKRAIKDLLPKNLRSREDVTATLLRSK